MRNLGSSFPTPVPPRSDREETPITIEAQAAPGEVALDAVIRAQSAAPQVRQHIEALESCIWTLADFLERMEPASMTDSERDEANQMIQRARQLLKARLEIEDKAR